MNLQVGGIKAWRKALFAGLILGSAMPGVAESSKYYRDIFPRNGAIGRDGRYYGTTLNYGRFLGGTAFVATPNGGLRILQHFPKLGNPEGGLGVGQDGAMYGSTRDGGAFRRGYVYKLERSGRVTVLHHLEGVTSRAQTLCARNGDLYVIESSLGQLIRYSKDGSEANFSLLAGNPVSLVEDADGEILLGMHSSVRGGSLWKLGEEDAFEMFAVVGAFPHKLVSLAEGGVLCLTEDRALRIVGSGEVEVLREFNVPFEGEFPSTIFVAGDGSYMGSTSAGGIERSGVIYRIDPQTLEYTVVQHLPHPEEKGVGWNFLRTVVPLALSAGGTNLPPIARDDVLAASQLKTPRQSETALPQAEIAALKNDADFNRDELTITAIGAPIHGSVELNDNMQTITYTASDQVVQNDLFSYTIEDGKGGSATGWVFIRTDFAGTYSGELSSVPDPAAGDPGTPAGAISVRMNAKGTLAGEINLLGEKFKFSGRLNEVQEFGKTLSFSNRHGTMLGVKLNCRPDGAGWILSAKVLKNYKAFTAECRIPEP